MLILRHFHGVLVGKGKDHLMLAIIDEQNVGGIMGQIDWLSWDLLKAHGSLRFHYRIVISQGNFFNWDRFYELKTQGV